MKRSILGGICEGLERALGSRDGEDVGGWRGMLEECGGGAEGGTDHRQKEVWLCGRAMYCTVYYAIIVLQKRA